MSELNISNKELDECARMDDSNSSKEEIRELVSAFESHRSNQLYANINMDLFQFYSEAYEVVFREYCQHVTSEQANSVTSREQAMVCRKDASELLLKCSQSLVKRSALFTTKDDNRFQILYCYILSSQYAKYSVWFNPKHIMACEKVIEICAAAIEKLYVPDIGSDCHGTSATSNRNNDMNKLIIEDGIDVRRAFLFWSKTKYYKKIDVIRKIELDLETQVH